MSVLQFRKAVICKFFERFKMENQVENTVITVKGGSWKLANQNGELFTYTKRGRWLSLRKALTPKVGVVGVHAFPHYLPGCYFSCKNKIRIICTGLPSGGIVIDFQDIHLEISSTIVLEVSEQAIILEVLGHCSTTPNTFRKEKLVNNKQKTFKLQTQSSEALHHRSVEPPRPRLCAPYLFVTTKKTATIGVCNSTPHRSVTLYNNGKHLYVKLPDGTLFHLLFRLTCNAVPCLGIPGCFFLEKDIALKHLGHTISGDVIIIFFDRSASHNWNLTVMVKKNHTIGVVDLFNAMGVTVLVG